MAAKKMLTLARNVDALPIAKDFELAHEE